LENAPEHMDRVEKEDSVVYCPGSKHKLRLKKLRKMILKELGK
jgi:hypothetical protein